MSRRLLTSGELTKAQILVSERRRFIAAERLHTAPLDGFFYRAPPIQARAGAASVPSFTCPIVVARFASLRFEIRQLHLFPQPVDDVVDAKLECVLDAAVFVAALSALVAVLLLRAADAIAGFGLTLSDTLLLVRRSQSEAIVLEHAHRHAHGARATREDIRARDDLRQMLSHCLTHFLVVAQPIPCASREQVVPACLARTCWSTGGGIAHCVTAPRPCCYS